MNAPAATTTETTLVPLTDCGLIHIVGPDATSFLHNLCTNDVAGLGTDEIRHGALCTAKGRMLASFIYWREDDGYLLRVAADMLPALVKKLSLYVLRAQVRVADVGGDYRQYGLVGAAFDTPAAMRWQAIGNGKLLSLGERRHLQIVKAPALIPEQTDDNAWRMAEIHAGVPHITQATQEMFVPQMVNFEIIGGVNFKKGCYPGQEIVARTQYLGKIKRRMYRVEFAADAEIAKSGAALYAPQTAEQSCGNLVSVAKARNGYEALAVIQSSCSEAGEIHLGAPGGPQLSLLSLPYAIE